MGAKASSETPPARDWLFGSLGTLCVWCSGGYHPGGTAVRYFEVVRCSADLMLDEHGRPSARPAIPSIKDVEVGTIESLMLEEAAEHPLDGSEPG